LDYFRYEFHIEGPDVKFGVERVSSDKRVEEIGLHKVHSGKEDEIGVLTHDSPTTCKFFYCVGVVLLLSYLDEN